MNSEQKNEKSQRKRNRNFRYVGSIDVCIKSTYGNSPQHSPYRRFYNCNNRSLPKKSTVSSVSFCFLNRTLNRFRYLVDTLLIYMDGSLGCGIADTEKPVKKESRHCLYDNLLFARFSLRNALRTCTSLTFRFGFQRYDSLDSSRPTLRLYTRHKQFLLRNAHRPAC